MQDGSSGMDGGQLSPEQVLEPAAFAAALPSALRISSTQHLGIEELKEMVLGMLVQAKAGLGGLTLTPDPTPHKRGQTAANPAVSLPVVEGGEGVGDGLEAVRGKRAEPVAV